MNDYHKPAQQITEGYHTLGGRMTFQQEMDRADGGFERSIIGARRATYEGGALSESFDEVQIEIECYTLHGKSRRSSSQSGSLVLSPEQAVKLARNILTDDEIVALANDALNAQNAKAMGLEEVTQ